jgi:hypothetical protein
MECVWVRDRRNHRFKISNLFAGPELSLGALLVPSTWQRSSLMVLVTCKCRCRGWQRIAAYRLAHVYHEDMLWRQGRMSMARPLSAVYHDRPSPLMQRTAQR